jgi:hypothetical protein
MPTRILALRSSPNTLAFSPHCSTGASGEPPNICAAPLGEKFQAIAAQNQLDQLLAEILALEQTEESLGRAFDALCNRLARLQLAGGDQGAEFLQRLGPHLHVLADDEAFESSGG